jgi:anion-transporting  ArsA/GET3 family ATPase
MSDEPFLTPERLDDTFEPDHHEETPQPVCLEHQCEEGILAKRFITVIGKGGVGKTTVAAALALLAARRGLKVLLAAVQAKDRLSDMLGCGPIGPHNHAILQNIDAVNMIPEANLEEYALMTLKFRALYRLVMGNQIVQSLLAGIPGLYQWALLGKATFHALEVGHDHRYRYDVVILDAPATGHGLELLRIPLTITEAIPGGPLRAEAQERWELLIDPARHEVLPVTLAEEMSVTETAELVGRICDLGLPVCQVVVNRMMPPLFSKRDGAMLANLELEGALGEVLATGKTRAGWQRVQSEQVSRLSDELPALRQVWLPHMLISSLGPESLRSLSYVLEALMAPPPKRPPSPDLRTSL